jgi:hypothetical protein
VWLKFKKGNFNLLVLFFSLLLLFTRYSNFKHKNPAGHPAFRLAGYPAKSVSGASLVKKNSVFLRFTSPVNCQDPLCWCVAVAAAAVAAPVAVVVVAVGEGALSAGQTFACGQGAGSQARAGRILPAWCGQLDTPAYPRYALPIFRRNFQNVVIS